MLASSDTSTTTTAPSKQEETTEQRRRLEQVWTSAKWGILIILFNLVYAHLMVARQLPVDPRQDSWVLMRSPLPTYLLSLAYLVGVTHVGPRFMGSRKPMAGLRPLMVVYNACQVVFSAWILYELGMSGWFGSYNVLCQPCDFSTEPQAIRMLHAAYWYFFSKFVDFLDTVFFVLNKKFDHISLLHVVHHSIMPVSMWYGIRYQPGGHNTFFGFLNTFVHIVMYTYYLLAAMGPRVRPFLWWKKYLTTLQMLQFVIILLHSLQLAFRECPSVTPQLNWWLCGNAFMFLLLFLDFYLRSYNSKRTKPQESCFPQENGKPSLVCGEESTGAVRRTPSGVPNGLPGDLSTSSGVSKREVFYSRQQNSPQDHGHM